jgi:phosphatidylserine synthase
MLSLSGIYFRKHCRNPYYNKLSNCRNMHILSLVLDFLDGFVARALKANSNLGAQLDSLADMVSFGLLPGLTMFKALEGFGNQFSGFRTYHFS